MRGKLKAAERDQQNRAWLAWHSGLIGRMTKPPTLMDLMGIKPVVTKQTPDEMKSVFAGMREAAAA